MANLDAVRPKHSNYFRRFLTQYWNIGGHKYNKASILAVVIVMGLAGTLILRSYAATSTVGVEAETGNLGGNYGLKASASASGGSAVIFGGGTTTPPPPPPPTPSPVSCATGGAATTTTTVSGFSAALASAKSGDVIAVTGSGSLSISGKSISGAPVTVKAATRGGTTLNSVQITNSSGITLEGFKFGPSSDSTYVKVASSNNIKVLRNTFDSKGITTSQSSIVTSGTSNTVDIGCNEFRDKDKSGSGGTKITGSYIKTQFDGGDAMTKNLHVYNNYFKNIDEYIPAGAAEPAGDSDREAIAMGIAASQSIVTNNVVEYNLFEDCDGENEIVTVKTSKNIFRNNTFKNSMGSLSFRLGTGSEAYNNYFYGTGASATPADPNYQTGGIRVYGTGHTIRDNFMKDLTGISWRLPILVDSGDTSNSVGGDSHQVSTNIKVTGNTILNTVGGGIYVGSANYGIKPSGNTITGNTVSSSKGTMFSDLATSGTWSGNKAFASGTGVAVGGTAKSSGEVQLLTAAPSITEPAFLSPTNVGPNGP